MANIFDPSYLEYIGKQIELQKKGNSFEEEVSRDRYSNWEVVGDRPVYANDNRIKESYKTQKDIKKNGFNAIESMFCDTVGASWFTLQQLHRRNNWANWGTWVSAACATACLPLFKIKSKSKRTTIVNQYTEIFNFPNRNETGWDMFFKTCQSLKKYGNAFWQVIKKQNGDLHSLYYIPATTMRAVPFINKENNVQEFCYFQINSYTQRVDRVFFQEEIIHFRLPNDDSIIYGLSPYVPLFNDFTFDLEGKKYINSWFQKTFTGGMIFKMANSNKDVVRRNRQEMKEKFEGAENAGRNLIMEGDMDLVSNGNKLKDMNFDQLKLISRDDILTCLGVPLSLAGIRSGNGSGNTEVISSEGEAMLRNNVSTLHKCMFGTLNLQLFRFSMMDSDLTIANGTNVTFSMKDAQSIAQSASKFAGTTMNENRTLLSLETKDDDDENSLFNKPIIATNNSIVPMQSFFESLESGINSDNINVDKIVSNVVPSVKVNPEKKSTNLS